MANFETEDEVLETLREAISERLYSAMLQKYGGATIAHLQNAEIVWNDFGWGMNICKVPRCP
jgi:hypothetical protein